jgi:hypothetical protein
MLLEADLRGRELTAEVRLAHPRRYQDLDANEEAISVCALYCYGFLADAARALHSLDIEYACGNRDAAGYLRFEDEHPALPMIATAIIHESDTFPINRVTLTYRAKRH